jgi:hypothetical protein
MVFFAIQKVRPRSRARINDSGAIVGTARYLGTNYDYLAASDKPRSMVPALTNLNEFYIICGHEIGRDLDLSSVDTMDSYQFDYGPWPTEFSDDGYNTNIANQAGLLSEFAEPQQNPWIRHEDSQEANGYASSTYSP